MALKRIQRRAGTHGVVCLVGERGGDTKSRSSEPNSRAGALGSSWGSSSEVPASITELARLLSYALTKKRGKALSLVSGGHCDCMKRSTDFGVVMFNGALAALAGFRVYVEERKQWQGEGPDESKRKICKASQVIGRSRRMDGAEAAKNASASR